jgi:hypothetical protein
MRVSQKLWDGSREDARYMQYFIERITHGTLSSSPATHNQNATVTTTNTEADWRPLLIQAIHRELAVRQCIIALSALIQERVVHGSVCIPGFDRGLPRTDRYVFALRMYGRALSSLQDLVEDAVASSRGHGRFCDVASVQSALLAGIVCMWFEVIMRDFRSALNHLDKCLRILLHTGFDEKGK